MGVRELVDVATLQKLCDCISDAFEVPIALVDVDGGPLSGGDGLGGRGAPWECEDVRSASPARRTIGCGDDRADDVCDGGCGEYGRPGHTAIPFNVSGRRVATWYVGDTEVDHCGGIEDTARTCDGYRQGASDAATACGLLTEAPRAVNDNAAAIVALVSEVLGRAASQVERMQAEIGRYRMRALGETTWQRGVQQLVTDAPVGLLELNRQGEITWFNNETRELLGLTPLGAADCGDYRQECTVSTIDGDDPAAAFIHNAHRLAKGEIVRGVRCVVRRNDGVSHALVVDATPGGLSPHRLDRVVLALRRVEGSASERDESGAKWNEVWALLNVANTKCITAHADVARALQQGVVDELQTAWLEFDSLRQDLAKTGELAAKGSLDTIAFQLKEATANAAELASTRWPDLWDHFSVAAAIERRLSDMESRSGVAWSFNDRSGGLHSLNATRCIVLYHVAEELLAEVAEHGCSAEVVLDANEHYWLLVVSARNAFGVDTVSRRSTVARIREELRPFDGSVETVPREDGGAVQYVIMPVAS